MGACIYAVNFSRIYVCDLTSFSCECFSLLFLFLVRRRFGFLVSLSHSFPDLLKNPQLFNLTWIYFDFSRKRVGTVLTAVNMCDFVWQNCQNSCAFCLDSLNTVN